MPEIIFNDGVEVSDSLPTDVSPSLNTRTPETSTYYGEELRYRKRGVLTKQAACSYLQFEFRDDCGNALDLTDFGFGEGSSSSESSSEADQPAAKFRFREAAERDGTTYEVSADVMDAANGVLRCRIPQTQVCDRTGIWLAEAGILDPEGCLLGTNCCYLYNVRTGWGNASAMGPPSLDQVRLSLRDSDPIANELIETFDFDVAEIAFAAARTVQFWNDQPPPVRRAQYTALSFPFREIWITGIQHFLFELAEEHYRRNQLKHSAGNTSTDDKNRHAEYKQAMHERFAKFRQLVMARKAQINADGAYRSLGSGYGQYGGGGRVGRN